MLTLLAYFTLSYILYRICYGIYSVVYPYILATPMDLHNCSGGAKWALITGSTDGIGKEYALQLGKKGFNLILISRTLSKLNSVKEEILKECKNNIEIETITFNFTNANLEDYKKDILSVVEKKDIGILVNNVGLANDPDFLHEIDLQLNANILIVNTLPVSILSAAILPQMIKRNAGIIINMSSGGGAVAFPYFSVYSSTKAYINHFSKILRSEYSNTNIIIQTISPGHVATNMSSEKISYFSPSAKEFAQDAIKTIGIVPETAGCIPHQIKAAFGMLLPHFMIEFLIKNFAKKMKDAAKIRKQNETKQQ
uniref:Steroid dehydrogenase n=1 Tax=Panagrolaimus davidi TaxID=227884 RepID=A0A914PCJ7_9BILA